MKAEANTELELLAPAGSFETLKAVIHAGADAVYVGGSMFGARAYAQNFNREEMLAAIDYGHIHNRKVFLTVNTLLKNREINTALYEYLLPYYEAGLDAVIVQDFGVMNFIRGHFPALPIHASTQMTITGVDGARLLQELGVSRIVTARELSLEEIAAIHQEVDVEIESFIHGALCYSYSGQCLFSSMLGGRSGNRGRCAQPCRLPYEVYDEKHHLLNPGSPYILSLKDLNTLEFLPQIAESGVYSFKIEGRMKSAQYAAGIVSVYRYYMDKYLDEGKESYVVTKEDAKKIYDFGNRNGFTDGYYHARNGVDMLTGETSSHSKSSDERTYQLVSGYIEKDLKEKINGKLTLFKGKHAMIQVWDEKFQVETGGDIVQQAMKRPLEKETILEKLNKTGNTPFVFENLEVEMEEDVFLPMTAINHMRQEALDLLKIKHLKLYRRKKASVVFSESPEWEQYCEEYEDKTAEKPDIIISSESESGFRQALKREWVTDIYLDSILYTHGNLISKLREDVKSCREAEKRVYFVMPAIFRADTRAFYTGIMEELLLLKLDGFVIRSYDELGFLKEYVHDMAQIRLDAGLYTFSDGAKKAFVKDTGVFRDTIPVELNRGELLHRSNRMSDLFVYGKLPLMISAGCVRKNTVSCKKQSGILYLKDRYGVEFPVRNHCPDCYNILYNAKPLFLLHLSEDFGRINPAAFRIHFTLEEEHEIQAVLNFAGKTLVDGGTGHPEECLSDYTNGHYKRGVE